jgi:hypothetical protein
MVRHARATTTPAVGSGRAPARRLSHSRSVPSNLRAWVGWTLRVTGRVREERAFVSRELAPRRGLVGALVALVALGLPPSARGQGRPDARTGAPTSGLCTLTRGVRLATEGRVPDPRRALSVTATATGALVFFRARGTDELVVVRVDDALARVGEDRVVAAPVTAFAVTSAPGGAALVAAERVAQGGRDSHDDVVLARLDTAGEARNVPRLLARVQRCDGVSILANEFGTMVAWGTLEGPASVTVVTDARGAPVGRARVVVQASSPTLAIFGGSARFAMAARSDEGASLLHIDGSGAAIDRVARPGTPTALVGLSSAVLSFATDADALSLTRWSPGSAPIEVGLALPRGVPPSSRMVHATADRATALTLFDDPSGREHLVRVAPDGSSWLLATLAGARGALAPSLDAGSLFVAAHGVDGAILLQRWACPGAAPSAPIALVPASAPDAGVPVTDASRRPALP